MSVVTEERLWEFQTRLMEEVSVVKNTCRANKGSAVDDTSASLQTYRDTMPPTMVVSIGNVTPSIAVTESNSILSETDKEIEENYRFIDLPQSIVMMLTPKVEVYKVYPAEDDTDEEDAAYMLHQGAYTKREIRRALSEGSATGVDDNMQGVVVEAVEFTRLGGNPAEVHTNIKFNIRLYAKSIGEFFTKTDAFPDQNTSPRTIELQDEFHEARQDYSRLTDVEKAAQAMIGAQHLATERNVLRRARSAYVAATRLKKVSWIDIIKIDPGQELNANVSNPSTPVNNPPPNNQLTASEQKARIKVKIGYALSGDKPSDILDQAWDNWKDAVDKQKEEFFLSLLKHEFNFLGMQGVELSVDFIATGNAKALQPSYDIFGGLDMARWTKVRESTFSSDKAARESHRNAIADFTNDIAIVTRDIELREAVIATRIQRLGSDSNSADAVFVASERAAGRATSTLVQLRASLGEQKDFLSDIESKISRCERKIEDILNTEDLDVRQAKQQRARFKIRLLEQLGYVGPVPQGTDLKTRIHKAKANIVNSPVSNIRIWLGSGQGGRDHDIALGDEEMEIQTEVDGVEIEGAFVLVGDIIEAAYEAISLQTQTEEGEFDHREQAVIDAAEALDALPEIRLTADNANAAEWQQRNQDRAVAHEALRRAETANYWNTAYQSLQPFCLQSADDFNKNIEALDYVMVGSVKYPNPAFAETEMLAVNIRDIPISYDLFRSWFHGKIRSMRSYPIRDFIPDLMLFVTEMFKNLKYRQSITPVELDDSKFPHFAINNVLYNSTYIPGIVNSTKRYVWIDFESVERGFQATKAAPNGRYITAIEQSNVSDMPSDNVPNIIFGQADRGILKNISFEREDIPGHAEARLMTDRQSVSSNIALREKYNVSIETRGTTSFLPGSVLYLDITPIELGYTDEDSSYAKQLGLGGMYRVVSVQSSIDLEGAGNKWNTKLKTKWESFGDGTDGSPQQITTSDELSDTESCL